MPRSFKLALPADWKHQLTKDPRLMVRAGLGILLVANLIAAFAVYRPIGGSAEELEAQITGMQSQLQRQQLALQGMRGLVAKIEQARTSGDKFMAQYFMDRRTMSSMILSELDRAAKEAGLRPKERAFAYDPVEGSDTLSMMTVNANYEGTYQDLLLFVNRLDKSPRFLILDSLVAAPMQGSALLNITIKMNAFVKDEGATQVAAAL